MSEFDDLFDDVIDADGESENTDNEFAFDESQFEDKPEESSSEDTEEKQEESKSEDGEADYIKFEENDYINYLLSAKGVDPHALLYEDEDGTEKTVNFYELSPEEQLNILNYNPTAHELEDDEIEVINFLRENNITLEEYTEYIKNETLKDLSSQTTPLSVDSISNEDLYVEVLKDQYPDLTDEEIAFELEKEKTNIDLFNKKVNQIRSFYKEQETTLAAQKTEEDRINKENELKEAQTQVASAAVNTKDFFGFELDDNDREDVMKYIFNQGVDGKSQFFKALENPNVLFKVALYALKGDEAQGILEQELKKIKNNNKPPIIKSPETPKRPRVTSRDGSSKPNQSSSTKTMTIDDLLKEYI